MTTVNRYEVVETLRCGCVMNEARGHIREQGQYASDASLSQRWITAPDCHSHSAPGYDAYLDPPGSGASSNDGRCTDNLRNLSL